MQMSHRRGVAPRLAAVVVVAILLASLGAYEYVQTARLQSENRSLTASVSSEESTISSLASQLHNSSASISSLSEQAITLSSPCARELPQPQRAFRVYPNGTDIVHFGYPILTLQPGSFGTFCMTYENTSGQPTKFNGTYYAYDWNSSVEPAGVSIFSNATLITVPPGQNATVAYAVVASTNAAGYFSVGRNNDTCLQRFEFTVSHDPSKSSFSNFPGLLEEVFPLASPIPRCQFSLDPFAGRLLTGFNGFGTTYLQNTTYVGVGYNVTSRYISSVVQSPSRQNITITVGVRSFASPLTMVFATGYYNPDTIRVFRGNPKMVPTPGDPCDWIATNSSAFNTFEQYSVVTIPGFTVNAPPVHVPPFSNATFKFSMEVDNPPPDYYLTFLGFVVQYNNTSTNNAVLLADFFPINAGSGQLNENITGACPPINAGPG
jgi:hypothetical protein